jgi:periplasmic divalent cation tolerance protein
MTARGEAAILGRRKKVPIAMPHEALVVFCTCPNNTVAAEIATALIEQNLAACVNRVTGVKSWYRWKGQLQQDEEVLLIIKTAPARLAELEAAVRRLHPYEMPELIALGVTGGSAAYLAWINEATTP